MKPPSSLAAALRHHRVSADLTLEALSERSGVSARTISDIERGVSSAPQSRTVAALADALGLAPGEHDGFLRAARARRRSRAGSSRVSAGSPHRVMDFAGRETEIAEVLEYISTSADLTVASAILLTGPPGIGKTSSAMEAIARDHDGPEEVLFVDLDGFSAEPLTPLYVVRALLRQMPEYAEKIPADLEEATRMWRAATAENPRSVVLDNAALEPQVRPVLTADARTKIVITSRRSLAGLEGIHRVSLGPLERDDSVALLERLIPARQRMPAELAELAELSDHVPLALRIVGNRIASRPGWSAGDFAERMRSTENRLRLLVAGDLAVEAAFALSYDDLDPRAARLFRSISVIDGATFDARIAAAAAGVGVVDAEDLLEDLTDLGLVESRGGSRYRLHDLLRLYASARLAGQALDHGDGGERDRLRRWLLSSLERAGAWFEPERSPETRPSDGAAFPDAATAQQWIRLEEPHWWAALKAAARLGEHEVVVDVADSLHWFSELWVEWGNWREFFTLAVSAARALGDARLEAMHLGYLTWSTIVETGDTAEGLRLAELAVEAAGISGDSVQIGWSKFYIAWMYHRLGRAEECVVSALESVAAFESVGDHDGAAQPITLLARQQIDRAGHERTIVALLQVAERMGASTAENRATLRDTTMLIVNKFLAVSYLAVDRNDEALAAADAAVATAGEFASGVRLAGALRYRANVLLAMSRFDEARRDIAEARLHLDPKTTNGLVKRERDLLDALGDHARRRISRPQDQFAL